MNLQEIMKKDHFVIVGDTLNKEKYAYKIKETLSRCGNFVYEIDKKETIDILYSFFNCRKNQKK